MKLSYCAAIAATLVIFGVAPALAQKKSASSLASIQLECFKAQGAYLDPVTKRYVMQGTDVDMLSRTDAVNKCVAEKTGKPATPFMQQETKYQ